MIALTVRVKKLRFREVTGLRQVYRDIVYKDIGYKDTELVIGQTRLKSGSFPAILNS